MIRGLDNVTPLVLERRDEALAVGEEVGALVVEAGVAPKSTSLCSSSTYATRTASPLTATAVKAHTNQRYDRARPPGMAGTYHGGGQAASSA